MAEHSNIQWTDATWSPFQGCSRKSAGCEHCYSERMVATRLSRNPATPQFHGLTNDKGRWTGEMRLHEPTLLKPLHWRKPRMIFVNSLSDTFHENVPDEWIDRVFAVMALCPQHTFQVLTKRPERMERYFNETFPCDDDEPDDRVYRIWDTGFNALTETMRAEGTMDGRRSPWPDEWRVAKKELRCNWPLPNVWLGTSVEHQPAADERIPHLLRTPAAVRFLSVEPLLGPVCLSYFPHTDDCEWRQGRECDCRGRFSYPDVAGDWVNIDEWCDWCIIGAESGPNRRPCDLAWVQSLVEQCAAAGVPVFCKQLPRPDGTISHDPEDTEKDPWEWPAWAKVRQFPEVTR